MVWSSKFAGAIPLSRWLRGIRWNHTYLQLRKQEMVVDSTFNFEKKRLTPTRRLVLGAATETARDEWKLSTESYMFFCCGNTQIRHERFHPDFHPCSMFCSWPPLQNMLFPRLFFSGGSFEPASTGTMAATVRVHDTLFVTGTTEIWWSRPSAPEIRGRMWLLCKENPFSQFV